MDHKPIFPIEEDIKLAEGWAHPDNLPPGPKAGEGNGWRHTCYRLAQHIKNKLKTNRPVKLRVYSGQVEHGVCGTPAGFKDHLGNDLFVGDIVMVASVDYRWNDRSPICDMCGLSVVVEDRPSNVGRTEDTGPFVMGLYSADLDKGWHIKRVKSWEDVIPGEHWKAYGFNYKEAKE